MRATSILLGLGLALAQPAGATVLSDWKLEEIIQRSDLIVIGTVRAARGVEGEGTILTASKIEVERTLFDASAGAAPRFIEVWELGGHLGQRWVEVPGTAGLSVGRRYLLFTFLHPDGHRYLVGMALGAYRLDSGQPTQTIDVPVITRDGKLHDAPGPRTTTLEEVRRLIRGRGP